MKYEGCIPYHFISFIDTRINIAKYIIEKYEELSYTTCELCGSNNATTETINGWDSTLCQKCKK